MSKKRDCLVLLMAFVAFLALSTSGHANSMPSPYANLAVPQPISSIDTSQGDPSNFISSTDPCNNDPVNNPVDGYIRNSANAVGENTSKAASATWQNMPKIDYKKNYCIANLVKIYQNFHESTSSITDPLNIVNFIVEGAINTLVSQVCSAVTTELTTDLNSITALTKICVPLPRFNLGGIPALHLSSCSGGMQFSMVGPPPPKDANGNPKTPPPFTLTLPTFETSYPNSKTTSP